MKKNIQSFDDFSNEKRECRWCYKLFTPKKESHYCCCSNCQSKYNNYLANDEAQKPWDKFVR